MKFTDAVTAQFFRTTNLPARTGTSHISNVLINCYKEKIMKRNFKKLN
jgi:hypothetical protein